ncbi:MAG: thiol:disulfide interchange protein DsbA/DsbL [Gammaproteobacteria bacterium]
MKPIYGLLAALLLLLMACTADEPAEPARDTPPPAAETAQAPPPATAPPANEGPADPVEESAALDAETEAADDVELALADPEETADAPASSQFVEGEHYRVLMPAQPTSSSPDQVEVAEVFWYGCPHCFTFEPYLENWRENLPSWVNFVRIPAVWNDQVRMHARAFYTAEALGKLEEIHGPLFREIHVNNNPLPSEDALASFFAAHGVDEETFHETFRSFAVETSLRRADTLNRRYQVQSVPVIVVNGKYVTDGEMAGGYEALLAIVDELAASEHE